MRQNREQSKMKTRKTATRRTNVDQVKNNEYGRRAQGVEMRTRLQRERERDEDKD